MTGNKHARHHGGAEGERASLNWRPLHHTRLFWVGLFMMLLAITLRLLDATKLFDIIFIMTNGGPGSSTYSASFYLYTLGFSVLELMVGPCAPNPSR